MLAEKLTAGEEQKLADDAMRARAAYEAKLAALETYYESRGNAERLIQVRKERKDEAEARHFEYVHWEDRLPELSATTEIPEATQLLKDADAARTALNPFTRGDRYKVAAVEYQQILHQVSEQHGGGLGRVRAGRDLLQQRRRRAGARGQALQARLPGEPGRAERRGATAPRRSATTT